MSLQAAEFFAELCLPFDDTVVGNTYFAAPPGTSVRLRIDFTSTMHADTYGGLRLSIVHPERGEIDAVALSFADHGTFHRRDEATNTRPRTRRYGTFDTYHRPGRPPWDGAVTTGLRDAIEKYTNIWFPGAWTPAPHGRTASPDLQSAPVPPHARTGARTR